MSTGIGIGIAGQVYDLKPGVPGGGTGFHNKYAMLFVPASNQELLATATPLLGTAGTGAWTISIWLYMNSIPSINRRIIDINSGGSSAPNDRLQLFYNGATNKLNISGAWTDNDPTVLAATTWYNVIYRYNGVPSTSNNAGFVINGTLINNKSNAVWNGNTTGTTRVGRNSGGGTWDGYLDELSIYDKYLTDAECIELYNSGNPTNLQGASFAANLTDWWRMGDPTGPGLYPTIPNSRGGAIELTMTNMTSANIQSVIVP